MGTHVSNSYERAFAVRNCCICSFDICSLLEIRSFDLNRLCTHIISYFVWNGSSFSSHCAYLVFVLFWNYRSHLLDSIFRFWWAFTIVWFIHNTHLVYVTYYVRMYFIRFTNLLYNTKVLHIYVKNWFNRRRRKTFASLTPSFSPPHSFTFTFIRRELNVVNDERFLSEMHKVEN